MRRLALIIFAAAACAPAASAQDGIPVAPFSAVELDSGGEVLIRPGPVQRVVIRQGDPRRAAAVVEDGRLRLGRCRSCPHGEGLRIEIVTPALAALSVSNGGAIVVAEGFPPQPSLVATVDNGGAIDARRLEAGQVTASVAQGGMIFARASRALDATVSHGGAISYWGDPRVTRSVTGGGVVQRGNPAEADRPLANLRPIPPKPPMLHPAPR